MACASSSSSSPLSSSSSLVKQTLANDFSFSTVHKCQDAAACQAIVVLLHGWDFSPYPPCTLKQLDAVDVFLLAYSTNNSQQHAAKELIGVIGVVWVPLRPGDLLEGYVQVVLVAPAFRRKGIGRRLLQQLRDMESAVHNNNNNNNDNASNNNNNTDDIFGRVARWRLHTLAPSQKTTAYLQRTLHNKPDPDAAVTTAEMMIVAVRRLYEEFGFTVRRNLYGYYDRAADAVEMGRMVPGSRKAMMTALR